MILSLDLTRLLIQFHRVEFKESVFEIVRIVRNPRVAISARLSSTLRVPIRSTTSPATTEGNIDNLQLKLARFQILHTFFE